MATVQILDRGIGHAAGLVGDTRTVVGAAHSFPSAALRQRFRVRFRDGLVGSAELVRKDVTLDLVQFRIGPLGGRVSLKWRATADSISPGTLLVACGHPAGLGWATAAAQALGERMIPESPVPLLAVRLATFGGASGGPVVDADGGTFVGTVVRGDAYGTGYAVPARYVRAFSAGGDDRWPTPSSPSTMLDLPFRGGP